MTSKPRLFSRRSAGCTLTIVRNKLANWVIAALLMLQLVSGLQWQAAHASVGSPERQSSSVDARHCPPHASKDSRIDEGRGGGASTSAPSSHDNRVHKYDCCGSQGCQCHGAQSPAVLDLPLASAFFPGSFILPFFGPRLPVARTNELFRPPIA